MMGDGSADGGANGAVDGETDSVAEGARVAKKGTWLDFLAFCEEADKKGAAVLRNEVAVCDRNEHGRGGDLLARVALFPTDDLDKRIRDEVDGPREVFLRTKRVGGQFDICGRLLVPKPKAAAASSDALVQHLMQQIVDMRAEMKAEREARKAATAEEPVREKVDALEKLSKVAKEMRGDPPPPPPPPPPAKSIVEQLDELASAAAKLGFVKPSATNPEAESVLKHAITTFGDAGNNFINAISGGLVKKLGGDDD